MADEPEDIELIDVDAPEDDQQQEIEGQHEEEGEDEFAIELEGEEPAEEEPPLVKQLRDEIRNRDRELSNYRKQAAPKIEVGEKPTIEGCDFLDEKYEAEMDAWLERKRQAESADREAAEAERVRNETQQKKFIQYQTQAQALPVKDFKESEEVVIAALPEILQTALLGYTKDTAKVVYALAKHPAKLEALAKETDPIKFVLAVNDLERNLKVVNRKKPPEPESGSIQRGSAPIAPNPDKKLAALEKEADRTGDRTKLIQYKKEMKKGGARA